MTTATWERSETHGTSVPGAAKGVAFVVLWAVAIALWVIAPGIVHAPTGAFVIDTGLVLASVGFALLFVESLQGYYRALLFAVVGILLFAVGDFAQWTPLVYFLRMFIPFLALLMPLNRFANGFRVFS